MQTTTQPLAVRDLVIEYTNGPERSRPIDGLSFTAGAGSLTMLLGPSGCGKTSLLSCVGGLLPVTSGSVRVAGHELAGMGAAALVAHRRQRVGIAFQSFNLVPSLQAVENVMVPLRANGAATRLARAHAVHALRRVGLGAQLYHRPAQLSGGQQQRVAIARAIVTEAPLLLADEPTAHLDHLQVDGILTLLRSLADEGRTLLVATHDDRIGRIADRVLDMHAAWDAADAPALGVAS